MDTHERVSRASYGCIITRTITIAEHFHVIILYQCSYVSYVNVVVCCNRCVSLELLRDRYVIHAYCERVLVSYGVGGKPNVRYDEIVTLHLCDISVVCSAKLYVSVLCLGV